LAIAYYEAVAEMVEALRPEVVGHLDLIRLNAGPGARLDTPPIRQAAATALEAIRDCGAILDVNTAGYRKGLGMPYPAPWLIEAAHALEIGFCFGDDSHGIAQVGQGIDQARDYLLENGVDHVTVLTRENGAIVRKRVPLSAP
jgi:histidinol-phosphatase (PHP family)